jgi:hypothetical protein
LKPLAFPAFLRRAGGKRRPATVFGSWEGLKKRLDKGFRIGYPSFSLKKTGKQFPVGERRSLKTE